MKTRNWIPFLSLGVFLGTLIIAVAGLGFNRLDRLDDRMDRLEDRMDRLEERFEGRMDRLEQRVTNLDGRVSRLEGMIETLVGLHSDASHQHVLASPANSDADASQ